MFYHKERHVATKYYMWWNHSIFYIHGSQILLIRYVIKSQYTWNFNCWSFSVRCWRICWWWREWCQQICWHNWWGKCCLWRWARMKGLLCRFPNTAHSTCAAVEKKKIIKKNYKNFHRLKGENWTKLKISAKFEDKKLRKKTIKKGWTKVGKKGVGAKKLYHT